MTASINLFEQSEYPVRPATAGYRGFPYEMGRIGPDNKKGLSPDFDFSAVCYDSATVKLHSERRNRRAGKSENYMHITLLRQAKFAGRTSRTAGKLRQPTQ
jgi:hypothetical protein